MNSIGTYPDSSSIVKRYLEEKGSGIMDDIYDRAEAGAIKISFSTWNVGEVRVALDQDRNRRSSQNWPSRLASEISFQKTIRLFRLGSLNIRVPAGKILVDAWDLIRSSHIYEEDAIQIASAKNLQCGFLLRADSGLIGSPRMWISRQPVLRLWWTKSQLFSEATKRNDAPQPGCCKV